MTWAIEEKDYSQRRACQLVGMAPKTYRYVSRRADDGEVRVRLRALANERRRFGYRRLVRSSGSNPVGARGTSALEVLQHVRQVARAVQDPQDTRWHGIGAIHQDVGKPAQHEEPHGFRREVPSLCPHVRMITERLCGVADRDTQILRRARIVMGDPRHRLTKVDARLWRKDSVSAARPRAQRPFLADFARAITSPSSASTSSTLSQPFSSASRSTRSSISYARR